MGAEITIYEALQACPRVLIVDNLYVGLDVATRAADPNMDHVYRGDISLICIAARKRDISMYAYL